MGAQLVQGRARQIAARRLLADASGYLDDWLAEQASAHTGGLTKCGDGLH